MPVFRTTEKKPTGPTQLLIYNTISNRLRDIKKNYLTLKEILQIKEIKDLSISENTKKNLLYKMKRKGYLQ
ncbi:TPA_asm: hypothetical protein vir520_00037 [Caudoviricetes sp. vir520]|nr:TPA_asm: hypothetical protein vir520_00037 [Caudoviricetes sp. vir520]